MLARSSFSHVDIAGEEGVGDADEEPGEDWKVGDTPADKESPGEEEAGKEGGPCCNKEPGEHSWDSQSSHLGIHK